jgi:hypothetical protein
MELKKEKASDRREDYNRSARADLFQCGKQQTKAEV